MPGTAPTAGGAAVTGVHVCESNSNFKGESTLGVGGSDQHETRLVCTLRYGAQQAQFLQRVSYYHFLPCSRQIHDLIFVTVLGGLFVLYTVITNLH